MQHDNCQTAERNAKPEKIGQQIGTEKLPWIEKDSHQAESRSCHADHKGALLQPLQVWP
jgi:hypothetical protein